MPHNRTSGSALRHGRATPELSAAPQHVPQLVVRSTHHSCEPLQVAMGGTAIERSMVNVGAIAVYRVKPVVSTDNKLGKKTTIFAVHVQNAITGRSWVVHRRFSDFLMLRGLITEHFKLFHGEFPRLAGLVHDLYFPKKHKFRHEMDKVVEHRCTAFLEFLLGLHRLLVCHNYIVRRDISPIGLSILRGFLGSAIVQDPSHRAYAFHRPILPIELNPSERTPINQCGSLTTVIEDDAEYEVEIGDKVESEGDLSSRDGSTDESDCEDTEEETARLSDIVDRRRSHKYARSRRVLHFLRKDGVATEMWSPTAALEHEQVLACPPRPRPRAHIEIMYVRASEMLLPSEMMRMSEAPKPISA